MKYLGIDYGTKRVGVATSDEAGEFAFPKAIFDTRHAVGEVLLLCNAENIEAIVIGESIASNEQENKVAALAKTFADKLRAETGLSIQFEREDFSSVEAHRYQTDAGNRDDSAAAIILQRFLDKQK